jgi:hypothetical protein
MQHFFHPFDTMLTLILAGFLSAFLNLHEEGESHQHMAMALNS